MHALITRPHDDAKPLADALAAKGIECTIEPLLQIVPIPETAIDLDGVQALLFTSANGVRAFAAKSGRRDLGVLAIGEGSAAAAREAGFTAVESAGGDVAALATLAIDRLDPKAGAVFHAAGSVLAGDLKGRLEQAGFEVRRMALYESKTADGFSPETRMNLTLGGIDLVLLFSPRTGKTFARLWAEAERPDLGKVTALCLSAAVAREVTELHWQRIEIAERPDQPAMLALVDAEIERRKREMAEEGAKQAGTASEDRTGAARGKPRLATLSLFLVLSMIAGGIVAGGITLTAPSWQSKLLPAQGMTAESNSDLAARVDALEAKAAAAATQDEVRQSTAGLAGDIAGLKSEIQALKDQVATLPTPASGDQGGATAPDLTPLAERLSKLEADLAALQAQGSLPPAMPSAGTSTPPLPDLAPEIDRLKSANETLSQELAAATGKIEALEALAARLDAVEGKTSSLEGKAAALDSTLTEIAAAPPGVTARQQLGAALVIAVGQLRGALGADKPYVAEFAAVHDLLSVDSELMAHFAPTLDRLQPIAPAGAPTLAELQASLPTTEIAQAAESEAGGAALGVEQSWAQRMMRRLSEVIVVRPVGGDAEGDGPLARLARGEAKLGSGDLAGAVAELSPLDGGAAKAAAGWLARAQSRLAQDQSAGELADLSAKVLAPAAGPSN
jgi:uroporphyrinogen-III synthase